MGFNKGYFFFIAVLLSSQFVDPVYPAAANIIHGISVITPGAVNRIIEETTVTPITIIPNLDQPGVVVELVTNNSFTPELYTPETSAEIKNETVVKSKSENPEKSTKEEESYVPEPSDSEDPNNSAQDPYHPEVSAPPPEFPPSNTDSDSESSSSSSPGQDTSYPPEVQPSEPETDPIPETPVSISPSVPINQETPGSDMSFIVVVEKWIEKTRNWAPHCSGVIYNDKHILTAASCLYEKKGKFNWYQLGAEDIRVVAGERDIFINDHTEQIRWIFNYSTPNYQPPYIINDIAVLELDKPLDFGYNVEPIILARSAFSEQGKTDFSGFDWACDRHKRLSQCPTDLQTNSAEIKKLSDCEKKYGEPLPNSFLCVGIAPPLRRKRRNAFSGDRGSPLVCQGYFGTPILCGIGIFKTMPKTKPLLFTRISAHQKWIESVAQVNSLKQLQITKLIQKPSIRNPYRVPRLI